MEHAIGSTGKELLVVRRKRDAGDRHLVAGKRLDGSPGVGVDEPDVVALGHGQGLAIAGQRNDRRVAVQRECALGLHRLSAPEFHLAISAAGEQVAGLVKG